MKMTVITGKDGTIVGTAREGETNKPEAGVGGPLPARTSRFTSSTCPRSWKTSQTPRNCIGGLRPTWPDSRRSRRTRTHYGFLFGAPHPYFSDGRTGQILRQFAGTVTAMGSAMAGRPRVIVALPDWTEGSLVANWLSENQFEPVHRSTMEAAASEIRTRPFNLIIADASWAVSKAFQTPDRGCNTAAPDHSHWRCHRSPGHGDGRASDVSDETDRARSTVLLRVDGPHGRQAGPALSTKDGPAVRRPRQRRACRHRRRQCRGIPPGIASRPAPSSAVLRRSDSARGRGDHREPAVGDSPSKDASKIWCGAALSSNPSGAEEAWRSFVDTVPIVGSSGVRVNL